MYVLVNRSFLRTLTVSQSRPLFFSFFTHLLKSPNECCIPHFFLLNMSPFNVGTFFFFHYPSYLMLVSERISTSFILLSYFFRRIQLQLSNINYEMCAIETTMFFLFMSILFMLRSKLEWIDNDLQIGKYLILQQQQYVMKLELETFKTKKIVA